MPEFLKKYWSNILIVIIIATLLLFIIPNQEKNYLEPEVNAIKGKSNSMLLWTEIVLFGCFFIFALVKTKSFIQMPVIIFNLFVFAIAFFFLFHSLFLSGAFFLNSLSKNNTVYKNYSVVYVDQNKNNLLLWDDVLKTSVRADQLLEGFNKLKIHEKDTMVVFLKKGLLGFNYDPKVSSIKIINDSNRIMEVRKL